MCVCCFVVVVFIIYHRSHDGHAEADLSEPRLQSEPFWGPTDPLFKENHENAPVSKHVKYLAKSLN